MPFEVLILGAIGIGVAVVFAGRRLQAASR
jgi:hypothetical protein